MPNAMSLIILRLQLTWKRRPLKKKPKKALAAIRKKTYFSNTVRKGVKNMHHSLMITCEIIAPHTITAIFLSSFSNLKRGFVLGSSGSELKYPIINACA